MARLSDETRHLGEEEDPEVTRGQRGRETVGRSPRTKREENLSQNNRKNELPEGVIHGLVLLFIAYLTGFSFHLALVLT